MPKTQKSGPVARPTCIPLVDDPLIFDPKVEPSRTKQSEAAACDINNIMARYQRTGVIDHVAKWGARYGEVPAIDFQTAMNIIREGDQMFADLPSTVRERFTGPGDFLAFVQDPANHDALSALGLTDPVPKPSAAEKTPPAAPQAASGADSAPSEDA